jgi:hypothetical protein
LDPVGLAFCVETFELGRDFGTGSEIPDKTATVFFDFKDVSFSIVMDSLDTFFS